MGKRATTELRETDKSGKYKDNGGHSVSVNHVSESSVNSVNKEDRLYWRLSWKMDQAINRGRDCDVGERCLNNKYNLEMSSTVLSH